MDANAAFLSGREADGMCLIRDLFQESEVFRIIELHEWKKQIDFRMPVVVVYDPFNTSVMLLDKRITAFQKILVILLILRHNDLRYLVHRLRVRFQHTSVKHTVIDLFGPFIAFSRLNLSVILFID